MKKTTCCTLILKVFIFLVEILLKTLCLKKFFDLLFFSFYRERSVIADISLTFDDGNNLCNSIFKKIYFGDIISPSVTPTSGEGIPVTTP